VSKNSQGNPGGAKSEKNKDKHGGVLRDVKRREPRKKMEAQYRRGGKEEGTGRGRMKKKKLIGLEEPNRETESMQQMNWTRGA